MGMGIIVLEFWGFHGCEPKLSRTATYLRNDKENDIKIFYEINMIIIEFVQGTFFYMSRASFISVGLSIGVGLILCLEPCGHSLYPIFLKVFTNTTHRQSIVFRVFPYVQDCLLIFVNSILS